MEGSHRAHRDLDGSGAWPRSSRPVESIRRRSRRPGRARGEQRAVFVYQIESYRYWQEQLKRTDFVHGQFGENFTIEGLPDDAVCVGDPYQIGSAVFEVTQPRVACYRVGIRLSEPRMLALLTSSGRPGFYFRVLQEGELGSLAARGKTAASAATRGARQQPRTTGATMGLSLKEK